MSRSYCVSYYLTLSWNEHSICHSKFTIFLPQERVSWVEEQLITATRIHESAEKKTMWDQSLVRYSEYQFLESTLCHRPVFWYLQQRIWTTEQTEEDRHNELKSLFPVHGEKCAGCSMSYKDGVDHRLIALRLQELGGRNLQNLRLNPKSMQYEFRDSIHSSTWHAIDGEFSLLTPIKQRDSRLNAPSDD